MVFSVLVKIKFATTLNCWKYKQGILKSSWPCMQGGVIFYIIIMFALVVIIEICHQFTKSIFYILPVMKKRHSFRIKKSSMFEVENSNCS